jgi:hypothetical protein
MGIGSAWRTLPLLGMAAGPAAGTDPPDVEIARRVRPYNAQRSEATTPGSNNWPL